MCPANGGTLNTVGGVEGFLAQQTPTGAKPRETRPNGTPSLGRPEIERDLHHARVTTTRDRDRMPLELGCELPRHHAEP
ncbi:MAG: hypothetical protein QG597_2871 [Actinomycetota bacterium]|nr:hypothetical protein [Actinomycetota bacterium]